MLAPDNVAATEQSLRRTLQASTAVTIYAAAMRFQVSPLLQLPLPSWFDPVKTTLEAAIGHARTWQDRLCGQVAVAVPGSFIDYNSVFQPTSNQLINVITEIEMSGRPASADLRAQAAKLLGTLSSHLGAQAADLRGLHASLVGLMDDVQQDHTAIADAESLIAQRIPDGSVISKQISAQLGDDFLDARIEGPCSVSLSIKESIELTIKETAGSHPELLPYVIASQVLAKAQRDNEAATQALSAVLSQWQLLQDLLQDVIDDLNKAADAGVLPILQKLDVQSAQGVWQQLQQFCEQLTSTQSAMVPGVAGSAGN
jgi:hypothetical protein